MRRRKMVSFPTSPI